MEYRLPLQELQYRIATHPDKPYLHQPQNRVWRSLTWADVDEQARRIAKGLLDQGFQPGDRIALLGKNSPEWFIADFAIAMAGLVSVPIYTTAGVQTIEHVLSHSGARAIFLGALENTEAAEQALLPGLPRIALPEAQLPCEHQWRGWIEKHPALEKTVDAAPSDTMTLVYTSGSTGLPKGVVLTHKNIAASADACANDFALTPDDRCMSYLPLAHITERCAVEWASVYGGDEIYFTESLDTFVDDVKHARPTLFISVPRLWTRFQAGVLAKMPDNKLQRLLKIPLVSGFVARKIRKNLGLDNCRLAGSGSAPISPSILRWYHRLGVNICEGWGMTETSGMACAAIPFEASTIGSICRPISCVEMKLSDEDEILIRGDSVFTEYYKNPEATAEVFSNDWFHTGDCASLDDKGVYRIIGRVKEQFKTGKGKYVAPV
ncbi:MAG TPA: AMP-dependent synthetase, partial [Porticoccaceae bacterium]|nr:AMP-dependent synthetase [Porticoccaceae bacterium]